MPTWCRHPTKKGDVEAIEKVQKRTTKLVTSLKNLSYRSSSSFGFTHTEVQKITWQGAFMTRCYTNTHLPYLVLPSES